MFYNYGMDEQLRLLTQDMNLEPDGEHSCNPVIHGKAIGNVPLNAAQSQFIPVSEVVMPNGKRMKVLKTLLTSACERNCYYCPFRAGRDMPRATYQPEQMAQTFMNMHRARLVEGMFLSSGIAGGGVRTQDKLLDTVDIIRNKYQYKGYIHLKIMPGSEYAQLERAMHLASRVSVNLEAPNTDRLQKLAPKKTFTEELLQPLLWAEEIRQNQSPHQTWNSSPPPKNSTASPASSAPTSPPSPPSSTRLSKTSRPKTRAANTAFTRPRSSSATTGSAWKTCLLTEAATSRVKRTLSWHGRAPT
jgi:hypothetical protein